MIKWYADCLKSYRLLFPTANLSLGKTGIPVSSGPDYNQLINQSRRGKRCLKTQSHFQI